MYGKVFESMFDGTLASKGPWQALVTFQQLIVLADQDGVVDMTADAIARRTSIPLDIIEMGISALLQPDPKSRTPAEDGRRIVLLEDHRDWGWQIVNHAKYAQMRKAEERREYLRIAQAERRAKLKGAASTVVNSVNTVSVKVNTSTHKDTDTDKDADVEKTTRKRVPAAPVVTVETLCLDGLAEDVAMEYLAHRKRKRANLTAAAWASIKAEIAKAGLTLDDGVTKALARGWTGFEASWVAEGRATAKTSLEARNKAVADTFKDFPGETVDEQR